MRFSIPLLLSSAACALALSAPQKPVVISYPADTPPSVIENAIKEIEKDGGIITHEYSLIKGFAAKVAEATLDKISALGEEFAPYIEEDVIVRIDGSTDSKDE
ncbi:uncharacterized protein PV06_09853 [Exophiala oligosperma]|uniref:Inhibitor I9 domain-containing protein n=2 Tax=Chaetothyriales TaxID=34395 RepID=A0A0D2AC29_9EURO|nr:uncharacterized protein PV06_09853 [Exophiala oligosperma]KAJ9638638.1 hypothetical protein H2204_004114 [Knufia peltigerae]KIW37871.1 hypothetical protein PV06_09853 [Exophiala oligosperma]